MYSVIYCLTNIDLMTLLYVFFLIKQETCSKREIFRSFQFFYSRYNKSGDESIIN